MYNFRYKSKAICINTHVILYNFLNLNKINLLLRLLLVTIRAAEVPLLQLGSYFICLFNFFITTRFYGILIIYRYYVCRHQIAERIYIFIFFSLSHLLPQEQAFDQFLYMPIILHLTPCKNPLLLIRFRSIEQNFDQTTSIRRRRRRQ